MYTSTFGKVNLMIQIYFMKLTRPCREMKIRKLIGNYLKRIKIFVSLTLINLTNFRVISVIVYILLITIVRIFECTFLKWYIFSKITTEHI